MKKRTLPRQPAPMQKKLRNGFSMLSTWEETCIRDALIRRIFFFVTSNKEGFL